MILTTGRLALHLNRKPAFNAHRAVSQKGEYGNSLKDNKRKLQPLKKGGCRQNCVKTISSTLTRERGVCNAKVTGPISVCESGSMGTEADHPAAKGITKEGQASWEIVGGRELDTTMQNLLRMVRRGSYLLRWDPHWTPQILWFCANMRRKCKNNTPVKGNASMCFVLEPTFTFPRRLSKKVIKSLNEISVKPIFSIGKPTRRPEKKDKYQPHGKTRNISREEQSSGMAKIL